MTFAYSVVEKFYTVEEDEENRQIRLMLEQDENEAIEAIESATPRVSLIRKLRLQSGMSVRQISEKLGISVPTFYTWEYEKTIPNPEKLKRFFAIVGHTEYPGYDPTEVLEIEVEKEKEVAKEVATEKSIDMVESVAKQMEDVIKFAEHRLSQLMENKFTVKLVMEMRKN